MPGGRWGLGGPTRPSPARQPTSLLLAPHLPRSRPASAGRQCQSLLLWGPLTFPVTLQRPFPPIIRLGGGSVALSLPQGKRGQRFLRPLLGGLGLLRDPPLVMALWPEGGADGERRLESGWFSPSLGHGAGAWIRVLAARWGSSCEMWGA